MRARLRNESGFALIGALLILIILMGIGVALVSMSDTQQNQSGGQRVKESAFNLAEAALNAEALQLGHSRPSTATCTRMSTATPSAPSPRCCSPRAAA